MPRALTLIEALDPRQKLMPPLWYCRDPTTCARCSHLNIERTLFQDGDIMTMDFKRKPLKIRGKLMNILVRHRSSIIRLVLGQRNTIADLKMGICDETCIGPDEQILLLNGQSIEDSECKLPDAGINNNSLVDCERLTKGGSLLGDPIWMVVGIVANIICGIVLQRLDRKWKKRRKKLEGAPGQGDLRQTIMLEFGDHQFQCRPYRSRSI